ncbi:MAG: hypothetical protein ABFD54_03665 [Armatimonadota bacterium]|nr:hypothetical protein [bacterium]
MMKLTLTVLTMVTALALCGAAFAQQSQTGNLGYNSYEGYQSRGTGTNRYFGSGVGYPSGMGYAGEVGADYYHRYIPSNQWGIYGYGTGHLGEGYGPYIFKDPDSPPPRGMFDPLPEPYTGMIPPSIKVKHGSILVSLPNNIPGIRCVTVTILAFNNAELATQTISQPPFAFNFPVMDGVKNVRVRIDYVNNGLSATSYPL